MRDLDKMELVAEIEEFPADSFTPMHVELNSFQSVRDFCKELDEFRAAKPIDRLICNAAVYQPSLPYAKWSVDGHEQQMQINYMSHFLMVSLLLEDMARAPDPRIIMVGSVTGNDNTVGGGGVYPIADLKDLEGLKAGAANPISMFDGLKIPRAHAEDTSGSEEMTESVRSEVPTDIISTASEDDLTSAYSDASFRIPEGAVFAQLHAPPAPGFDITTKVKKGGASIISDVESTATSESEMVMRAQEQYLTTILERTETNTLETLERIR